MLMSCFFPWNIFRVCFPHQWVLHSGHVALLLVSLRFAPHLLLLWPDSPGLDSLPLCYIPGGLTSGRKSKGISVLLPLRWVTSDSNWSLTGPSQHGTTLSSVVPVPSGTPAPMRRPPRPAPGTALPVSSVQTQGRAASCCCPAARYLVTPLAFSLPVSPVQPHSLTGLGLMVILLQKPFPFYGSAMVSMNLILLRYWILGLCRCHTIINRATANISVISVMTSL